MAKNNKKTSSSAAPKKTQAAPAPKLTAVPPLPAAGGQAKSQLTQEEKAARREEKAANRKPLTAMAVVALNRIIKRLGVLQKDLAGADDVISSLRQVAGAAGAAISEIEELPEGWAPVRRGRGRRAAAFEIGQVVELVEARRVTYEGMIEADEWASLKVTAVLGKNLAVKLPDGTKVRLPAAHVRAIATSDED